MTEEDYLCAPSQNTWVTCPVCLRGLSPAWLVWRGLWFAEMSECRLCDATVPVRMGVEFNA